MFFACTRTRAFSYKKQAHATVANEDFKAFENNLKASDRQERKSPFIWIRNEQNYEDKEKGEEFASGSAQIFALCRFFCRNLRKACACLGAFGRSPKVATRLAAFASFAAVSYKTSTRHGAR